MQWKAFVAGVMLVLGFSAVAAPSGLVEFADGDKITEADLNEHLGRRLDLRSSARNSWGVENVLREMAMTRVLMHEGVRLGEPRPEDRKHLRFDDVYALSIYKKLTPACDAPADVVASRKFYDENPDAFKVPPMARLSRVMLPKEAMVDGEPAGGWLILRVQEIGAGKISFQEVASKAETIHKIDPQGDLGWVTLVEEAPILRALASANQGDLVGPVPEGDFVYLFRIEAKRDARTLSWDEAASIASKRAVTYCREQSSKKLQQQLFSKYGVVIHQPAIRELFKNKRAKQ